MHLDSSHIEKEQVVNAIISRYVWTGHDLRCYCYRFNVLKKLQCLENVKCVPHPVQTTSANSVAEWFRALML